MLRLRQEDGLLGMAIALVLLAIAMDLILR